MDNSRKVKAKVCWRWMPLFSKCLIAEKMATGHVTRDLLPFISLLQAACLVNRCAEQFLQILQEKADAVDVHVPFCRLAFDVALRCTMGAEIPVQRGGQETDHLMNNGRNSVAQFATSWLVFLSKSSFLHNRRLSVMQAINYKGKNGHAEIFNAAFLKRKYFENPTETSTAQMRKLPPAAQERLASEVTFKSHGHNANFYSRFERQTWVYIIINMKQSASTLTMHVRS